MKPSARRRSSQRLVVRLLGALSLGAFSVGARAECVIAPIAVFKVTMSGMRPQIGAEINGVQGSFIVDSGSYYSIISAGGADRTNLRRVPAPSWLVEKGSDGKARASVAEVEDLVLEGLHVSNVAFLVGGNDAGTGTWGVLGATVFQNHDVEYDLANGVIRLMRAEGCSQAGLAYWATGSQTYSVVDTHPMTPAQPFMTGSGWLNGSPIRLVFDTGAYASTLSTRAATQAGVATDSPNVMDVGYSVGIGRPAVKTYLAPFASIKIGDEEIRNVRLRFGDIRPDADMLVGADFFLSHRIYVSNSQNKLYFTYNGGPVFNLSR